MTEINGCIAKLCKDGIRIFVFIRAGMKGTQVARKVAVEGRSYRPESPTCSFRIKTHIVEAGSVNFQNMQIYSPHAHDKLVASTCQTRVT